MYGKKVAERILAIEYNRRKMTKDQRFRDEEKASRKLKIPGLSTGRHLHKTSLKNIKRLLKIMKFLMN